MSWADPRVLELRLALLRDAFESGYEAGYAEASQPALTGDGSPDHFQAWIDSKYAAQPLTDLHLSPRPHGALTAYGIQTTGELLLLSEEDLYDIRGIGHLSVEEILRKRAAWLESVKKLKENP